MLPDTSRRAYREYLETASEPLPAYMEWVASVLQGKEANDPASAPPSEDPG